MVFNNHHVGEIILRIHSAGCAIGHPDDRPVRFERDGAQRIDTSNHDLNRPVDEDHPFVPLAIDIDREVPAPAAAREDANATAHRQRAGAAGAADGWCDFLGGELRHTLQSDRRYERLDITGLTGITEAQRDALLALGAVDGRA